MLLAGIMNRLERMVGILQHQGFEPLKQDYTGCWLHTDQQVSAHAPAVSWVLSKGGSSAQQALPQHGSIPCAVLD